MTAFTVLIFTACLVASPNICREETVPLLETPIVGCFVQAPPNLAAWVNEHPGYVVKKWACGRDFAHKA